jgi:hypothetical protein
MGLNRRERVRPCSARRHFHLRTLEPPYHTIEKELADRFVQADGSKREQKIRNVVQEICDFMNKNERRSSSS